MAIRIVHTADNHVGITFQRYRGEPRTHTRLVAERIDALRRIVAEANRRNAHFVVVAGDLFDRPNVPQRDVEATVQALAGFSGEAVLVLPGNHDFYDGPAGRLWKWFRDAVGSSAIHLLAEPRPEPFSVDGQEVRFYPCPCPSKLGEESLVGWVGGATKEKSAIHVGIAHGNVEGLGMDEQGRYFNMRQEELRSAGVATWLLGHIHVPFPAPGSGGRPAFFIPGIHTPDSIKCSHPGHAWCIDVEPDGVTAFDQIVTGTVRFVRFTDTLRSTADIADLRRKCDQLAAADTVLDLQLDGRLRSEERRVLDGLIADLGARFLSVSCEQTIAHELDAAELSRLYPTGSLAHRLLERLIGDAEHPDAAWLAHELFQEERRA